MSDKLQLPIHFGIGIAMLTGAINDAPDFFGLFFVVLSLVAITFGWAFGICLIIAGKNLARRRRHMFCLVMAAISCMFMPFGTEFNLAEGIMPNGICPTLLGSPVDQYQ